MRFFGLDSEADTLFENRNDFLTINKDDGSTKGTLMTKHTILQRKHIAKQFSSNCSTVKCGN